MAHPPASAPDPALRQRIVSGIVLGVAAIVAAILGGWPFVGLVLVAMVIMAIEWARLAGAGEGWTMLAAATAIVPALSVLMLTLGAPQAATPFLAAGALAVAALAALRRWCGPMRAAGGVLYIGIPALALVWLRATTTAGAQHLLWLLIVIWRHGHLRLSRRPRRRRATAGTADQPRQDLGGPAGRCGRRKPVRRPGGAGARRRLRLCRAGRRRPRSGRPGGRSVRVGPQAAGGREGQLPPDSRPRRTARSDRRPGVRRAGVRRPGLDGLAGREPGHDGPAGALRPGAQDGHPARRHGLDRAQHAAR